MTMPDDLSALGQRSFADAVLTREELLAQSGRAFLLGAGCSKRAGLPLAIEPNRLGKEFRLFHCHEAAVGTYGMRIDCV